MSGSPSRLRIRRLQRALRLSLRERGRCEVHLAGTCMRPLLPPGELITLEDRPPRRGEVVIFETAEGWAAHRVVARAEGVILTHADRPGAGVERIASSRAVGVWVAGGAARNAPRFSPGLSPTLGRAASRVSHLLSGPRVLPVLRGLRDLRDRSRFRLSRAGPLSIRCLEPVEAAAPCALAALSALGLYRDAEVVTEASAGLEPPAIFVLESAALFGGLRGPVIRGGLRVNLDQDRRHGWIGIAIAPRFRGRGHGRALLEATLAWARREGLDALHVEIARDDRASRRLFLGEGYQLRASGILIHPGRRALMDAYQLTLSASQDKKLGL